MTFKAAISLLAILGYCRLLSASTQDPFTQRLHRDSAGKDFESIAIIGAGISGAISAFELNGQSRSRTSAARDVTIFKKGSTVGGRIQSVLLPRNKPHKAETGAAYFHTQDWCINKAINDTGHRIVQPDPMV